MNTLEMTLEQKAIELGNNEIVLEMRLREAAMVLSNTFKPHFIRRNCIYDFTGKRLISTTGKYQLVWQIREKPDKPESYMNQQTSTGCCMVKGYNR